MEREGLWRQEAGEKWTRAFESIKSVPVVNYNRLNKEREHLAKK